MKTKSNRVELISESGLNGSGKQTWKLTQKRSINGMRGDAIRFYPDQLPSFQNEPTRDKFQIGYIGDGVGEGVTSLVSFEAGDVVFGVSGFFSNEVTLFSLQIAEDLHLHDPYFYGKLLHSCDPNTYVDLQKRVFIALKPILPGDFVTLDYARTEDYLFRTFPCDCGAANCRGIVAGRKQLLELSKEARS
ncbi:MAG: SET domain-containing protein-lysine N-methyltransferase [Gammaproteobacteria bacterium]|nr:SET domain-containing protein-lysine N-methyltransferase [Gammaproteobacteria bacterium]